MSDELNKEMEELEEVSEVEEATAPKATNPSSVKLKNEKADYYREKLQNIDGVVPPLVKNYNRHTFMLYSILTKNNSQRQKIITELNKKGIETRINFPPVHLQPVYAKRFNFKVDSLPVTEDIANRILGLPIFIKMTNEQQDIITESIKRSIGN